ncbi:MAG: asparagine synthase (glutamine-hydrolyzing) [Bryobacterales bacterium]|nr:asparagine synthase (glutamine-hydrolyzing) [Bryobacterales bacterium]
MAGLLTTTGFVGDAIHGRVADMVAALRHRGPDDFDVWVDARSGIGLGHSRLSIVDLSKRARQPMQSACGNWVVTYNGEIYNFRALRRELSSLGCRFRGESDTEVLLAAVSCWGIERALSRFVGMFAFALWNKADRTLTLARDRMGEKPLHYGWCDGTFVLASELSALREGGFDLGGVDEKALASYMRFNYVPAPQTIYRRIHKLPAGTTITVKSDGQTTAPVAYWTCDQAARDGISSSIREDSQQAADQLDSLLRDAVSLQTVADVPVGAFLSGGVDSATVVALMADEQARVRTFTIGYADQAYDEAPYARAIARHLGTDHTELRVTAQDAIDVIPDIPRMYGEPFADSSQIPTYFVSKLAHHQVTVALSGDGADELFGGYDRYYWANSIWRTLSRMPRVAADVFAASVKSMPPAWVDSVFSLLPLKPKIRHPGDKAHKLAHIMSARSFADVYLRLVSSPIEPARLLDRDLLPSHPDNVFESGLGSCEEQMMLYDLKTYLPDDILAKVDRAGMANSLETRAPFLDHRIVEFSWRLPVKFKIRPGASKWILRQVLLRYVPKHLVDRPKSGFAIPLDSWLRGSLRPWAEDLLSERRLRCGGYFRAQEVRRIWAEHLEGTRNWIVPLWAVLMFQAWLEDQHTAGRDVEAVRGVHA